MIANSRDLASWPSVKRKKAILSDAYLDEWRLLNSLPVFWDLKFLQQFAHLYSIQHLQKVMQRFGIWAQECMWRNQSQLNGIGLGAILYFHCCVTVIHGNDVAEISVQNLLIKRPDTDTLLTSEQLSTNAVLWWICMYSPIFCIAVFIPSSPNLSAASETCKMPVLKSIQE